MDLTKRDKPSNHLGQYTGKEFEENAVEAQRLIKMITPSVMEEGVSRGVLTRNELILLADLAGKLNTMGKHASVTGRTLFYLRDIKDKLVERGLL